MLATADVIFYPYHAQRTSTLSTESLWLPSHQPPHLSSYQTGFRCQCFSKNKGLITFLLLHRLRLPTAFKMRIPPKCSDFDPQLFSLIFHYIVFTCPCPHHASRCSLPTYALLSPCLSLNLGIPSSTNLRYSRLRNWLCKPLISSNQPFQSASSSMVLASLHSTSFNQAVIYFCLSPHSQLPTQTGS